MRAILYCLVLILFASCDNTSENEISNRNCVDIEFDIPFQMEVGSSACLMDGRMIKLLSVEDQYCPCDAICDWGGQLLLNIELTYTNGSTIVKPLSISDSHKLNSTFDDITTKELTYIYLGQTDILPLCEAVYNQEEIMMIFTFSI